MELSFYCVGDRESVNTKPAGYRLTQPRELLDGSQGQPRVYAYAKCPQCGRNITRFVSATKEIMKQAEQPKKKETKPKAAPKKAVKKAPASSKKK